MKKQFMAIFEELDRIIESKYDELNRCASDQTAKEQELEQNRRILDWLESCMKEIDEILNI